MKKILYHIEIYWWKFWLYLGVKRNKKIIPKGMYCYEYDGTEGVSNDGLHWYGINRCKYYRDMKRINACTYLGYIGFDYCLYDQCKICDENRGIENSEILHQVY